MADDRPAWARRMYNERQARSWSQADAVRAMRAHYSREHPTRELPDSASLLRQYKRWEAGEVEPDRGKAEPLYKPVIAATFGTVTHAMFPVAPKRDAGADANFRSNVEEDCAHHGEDVRVLQQRQAGTKGGGSRTRSR